jgi:DNA-directed RNA polymerase subunit RPC12/RpoP
MELIKTGVKKIMALRKKCTRCGWEGPESELVMVNICPDCSTGHSPLWRLMKKLNDVECPNCSWRSSPDMAKKEPECPKCGDEYLKDVEPL